MTDASQGRLPGREPVAVVDIGSNSVRLVIYEGVARSPTVLFNEKMLAGLGKGIALTGRLDPVAVERALEEFRRFRALADQAQAKSIHVIATAAAREAENGPDFIAAAGAIFGSPIRVLSGREEAHFAGLGVVSGFHRPDGVAGDLGGGSLELVDIHDRSEGEGVTLPLGGLRLADMARGSLSEAQKIAKKEIARSGFARLGKGRPFYAIGGAWRNLARLHMLSTSYPLEVMHHYETDPSGIASFLKQVAKGDADKIKGIDQISKSRRALLSYGAIVLQEVIDALKPSRLIVSAFGVREGYLHSLLSTQDQKADPLISAAEELAVLRARSVAHARELVRFTAESFHVLGISETENEARSRIAACLLADISWRAHPEYRGLQAMNLINHASFVGIDHAHRSFIALANLWRHEGLYDDAASEPLRRITPERLIQRAKVLAALMRVVYILSASMPGLIPRLRWIDHGDHGLSLMVPKDKAWLVGERPRGRLDLLGRIVGLDLDMQVDTA
ncbi:MAG: Ppx/GppA family phosphatase [Phyllobacteriaceae bacterium]|nr:Ppx/GppA family phosphatase [Phyllobacteriaceae bacterium]